MKLDIAKKGLMAIWREYEVATIEDLLKHDERTSGEVYSDMEVPISRASVINFLNRLVDDGLANYREDTGKGGHHRVYSLIARSWDELDDIVIDRFLYKLWEIFPSSEKMSQVIKI